MNLSFKQKGIAFPILVILLVVTLLGWGGLSEVNSSNENGLVLSNAFPSLSFEKPVDFQNANDGSNRLFVVEKSGLIHVFNNTPSVNETQVFLDISHLVSEEGNEMGLLGLAFHPEFESNGFFFVDYTANNPRRTVIARYQVPSNQSNQANITSEYVILEIPQPYTNHNGGQISFGPEGYLYIAMGDGGSGGDPLGNGQNKSSLLGALLRIDIDQSDVELEYSIPDTNPFYGNTMGFAEEIFAYGLRNPWRFSFDSESGLLLVADVGQNAIEEIDIVENGGNYGWNIMEGTQCYASTECENSSLIDPLWEYGHNVGTSITGGYVYRGARLAQIYGKYIFGDFTSGRIWALEFQSEVPVNNTELFDLSISISSFGVDENQELYIISYAGSIYSLEPEEVSTSSSTTPSTTVDSTTSTSDGPGTTNTVDMTGLVAISFGGLGFIILMVVVILAKKPR
jgi:glucose/arabinose dehydrogenase